MFNNIRRLYIKDWEPEINKDVYKLLENKSILVTGATGLIGTGLIDFLVYINKNLNLNMNIYALGRSIEKLNLRFKDYIDKEEIKVIVQDICELIDINIYYDYIIHAASNAHPIAFSKYPVETMKANIEGTINLLEYCKKNNKCKFLFISTSEVYGNIDTDKVLSETDFGVIDCNTFRSSYPESKRVAETLCNVYASQYNINTSIARLCYIYGPTMTDSDSRVIAQFIRNILNNEDIVLKSDGNQIRSYCYLTDAITGIIYALIKGENKCAYNISNKLSNTSIRNIAEILSNQNGLNVKMEIADSIESNGYSKQNNIIIDSSRLRDLGWEPKVSLEEGLYKCVSILKNINI